MNGLPTCLNMEKRGIEVDAKCPLCEKAVESTKHAVCTALLWKNLCCMVELAVLTNKPVG